MLITTKFGDSGKTSLYRGKTVAKDHPRIEACGIVDELNSYLGFSKSLIKAKKIKMIIESIQSELFLIGSEIVTEKKYLSRLKQRIDQKSIKRLEGIIKQLQAKTKNLRFCFCLPGVNLVSGSLDVSRVLARRLERRLVTFKRRKILTNKSILVYLNRLSDLIFLLARSFAAKSGSKK
ncbi:MAG: cob(I)yrinic acid a,c-diamide adenosyltransferase [Candidatus Omnitrophica bacterium]|nr:cob(I)yrinic acid a,c-diamide adenosyltransferase [Candidatus Omnitrophota bacterium]MBU2044869.1 cob(I)yrinic acid a,c-diamide adenosyltransferase [Candidatus Omnitrophota bacterium]MBU2251575.1 cob(I)yrinic acid a,c-diamide adenosyltransferase [Candidatus Omnitrophota bacterium]MBU2473675.1 cob(I)yrinic acid a,c-diamide adenosyltransferase [Candidatus Omnitrophota bacterium]